MRSRQLNVFVYGTLKRGQRNHERFCGGFVAAGEASVRGLLYELPFGFPALVVPETDVHAVGTTDYLPDTETQHRLEVEPQVTSPGWDAVHGELFTFDDPEERLPALDGLEGFSPGAKSFYERVLIPTMLTRTGTTVLAWVYAVEQASGIYLPGGRWPVP